MTKPAAGGKETPPQATGEAMRAYAMRPLGGLIARVTRPGFRRRSPAAAQIMMDWLAIMGPLLGARTVPQKLSAGTLTIGCQGPVAMELQHLAPQLIERLNSHIGQSGERALIQRLRFVPVTGLPTQPAAPRKRPAPPPAPEIPGLEPGPLHDALARLGQSVLARQKPR